MDKFISRFWLTDPKTGKKSVSLSLLVYSTLPMLVLAGLATFEIVINIAPFMTLYGGFLSLYFGRRIKISRDYVNIQESLERIDDNE